MRDKNGIVEKVWTAGGVVTSDETVIRTDVLPGEAVRAQVLADTPNALQLGSRCARQGYGIYWHPFDRAPKFVAPDGSVIECDVDENYIPVIRRQVNPGARRAKKRGRQGVLAIAMPAVQVQTDP